MRQALVLLLASLLVIGFADATLKENIKPGKATVELGSYKMSFSLPDDVRSYDIETVPMNTNTVFSGYDVNIREAGKEDELLVVMLYVYNEPQYFPIYEQVVKDEPTIAGIDPLVTIPMKIDGSEGHVIYSYPEGDPAIDPLKANGAGFKYYPRAQPKGTDLSGVYEVSADTFGSAAEDSRVIPIVQEVIRTIHLSGI
jgi:hypothetical protein